MRSYLRPRDFVAKPFNFRYECCRSEVMNSGIVAWPDDGARRGAPLAELQLVAVDAPVDESKFVVAKSLTEDGRIGKVADAQGIVVLRPPLAQRWTSIGRETLLKPGDWLRTELRGANAAKVRLSSEVELIVGPGSLIESPVLRQRRVSAACSSPQCWHETVETIA